MLEELNLVRKGNLVTLAQFDKKGFILGANESLEEYANRITQFLENHQQLQADLEKNKLVEIEDLKLKKEQIIPNDFFNNAKEKTKELYNFSFQQISGFFVNLGLLFGGCAYIFPKKFFSLFFIRSSFIKKDKWFLYERDEIIAHESCHIARFALNSIIFEEIFAYQTSKSKFRQYFASMLQQSSDTYIIISAIILTIIAQIVDYLYPPTLWFSGLQLWAWASFIIIIAYFIIRQCYYLKQLDKAKANLSLITDDPLKLAFRLTDQEIMAIAREEAISKEEFITLINSKSKTTKRSEVLVSNF